MVWISLKDHTKDGMQKESKWESEIERVRERESRPRNASSQFLRRLIIPLLQGEEEESGSMLLVLLLLPPPSGTRRRGEQKKSGAGDGRPALSRYINLWGNNSQTVNKSYRTKNNTGWARNVT